MTAELLAAAAAGSSAWPWALAVAAVAAAVVAPRLWSKRSLAQRKWERVHRDLAQANGLTPAEAKLLWRLGVAAGLENPALVFVRPSLFESRAAMAGVDADTVGAIRGKLWGG